jgi:hypothetical protein
MNGHWYCPVCEDVISYPAPVGRWDAKVNVDCPICHRPGMCWVNHPDRTRPARCVTAEEAKQMFDEIRKVIE